ncbi:PREDICTED: uncharacterized protein LOC105456143 [Wasmannia auropunctata]|uniref:uncharacterized protein LOC105456143 n=1 Tax=Wasmannia auropunctata TaxID=64793 RepID=UPI0005EF9576|nr:PREDICTED: uncharacterized protein LOC105456143 [Wasmannia auropunctata]
MSLIRLGADNRLETELYQLCDLNLDLYHEDIKAVIVKMKVPSDGQQCIRVTYKGTEYVKGHALMIRQNGYEENITIGKICLFLCSVDTHVYVLFEVVESYFRPYLRAYQLGPKIRYECLLLHDIMDFKPMHIYDLGNMLVALEDGTEIDDDDIIIQLSDTCNTPLLLTIWSEKLALKETNALKTNIENNTNVLSVTSVENRQASPSTSKSKSNRSQEKYVLDMKEIWNKVPSGIFEACKNGEKLLPKHRQSLNRVVADYMINEIKATSRAVAEEIAHNICETYPLTFKDIIGNEQWGSGIETLRLQIYNCVQYMKHTKQQTKRSLSPDSDDVDNELKKKEALLLRRQDEYGGVEYASKLPSTPISRKFIFKFTYSSSKNMPKPFHELCKKAKIRRLNAEDVEEATSSDSQHSELSYHSNLSHHSEIDHRSELSYHSDLSHYSDISYHSEVDQSSKCSEQFEYWGSDDYEESVKHEYIDNDGSPNHPHNSPSNSSSRSSEESVSDNSKMLKFLRS